MGPTQERVLRQIPEKYRAVVVAAKRARDLLDREEKAGTISESHRNYVVSALVEVADGRVSYVPATRDEKGGEASAPGEESAPGKD